VETNVEDPILAAAIKNNADHFRKRRHALAISPDLKVATKLRVLGAKVNLSQRIDTYRLVY
jgi:hypothetical protein